MCRHDNEVSFGGQSGQFLDDIPLSDGNGDGRTRWGGCSHLLEFLPCPFPFELQKRSGRAGQEDGGSTLAETQALECGDNPCQQHTSRKTACQMPGKRYCALTFHRSIERDKEALDVDWL